MNLLYYLVQTVQRKEPEIATFVEAMSMLPDAINVEQKIFETEISKFSAQFNKIKNLADK